MARRQKSNLLREPFGYLGFCAAWKNTRQRVERLGARLIAQSGRRVIARRPVAICAPASRRDTLAAVAALPALCPCLSCGAVPQVKQTDISLLVAFCPSPACESVACLANNREVLARLWNARNRPGRFAAPDTSRRVLWK